MSVMRVKGPRRAVNCSPVTCAVYRHLVRARVRVRVS